MLKKTITCEDFDGNEYTEDYYFHLNKTELAELNLGKKEGFYEYTKRLLKEDTDASREEILRIYRDLILKSYGKKSADGKRFIKSPEISKEFSETNAYEALYMELIQSDTALRDFVRGVLPKEVGSNMTDEKFSEVKKDLVG